MGDPASSDTETEASRETEIGLLAEALRETPRAIWRMYPLPRPSLESLGQDGDGAPYRGLPWRASGETETAPPAEAFPGEPRVRQSLFQDAETSCSRLEARRRRTQWAQSWRVRGPRLTF